ncbi:MAG: HIT domain-containing protein [Pirellulales bacterium]|nr:HIT domain-containing protein [Pirellulales bacterium]
MTADPLWAPWRIGFVLGEKENRPLDAEDPVPKLLPDGKGDCFLCQSAVTGQLRARHVVARDEQTVSVLNLYPYNNGHLLVAPRRHVARLDELTGLEAVALTEAVTRSVCLLERVMQPEGFNIGLNLGRVAGAGLPGHLHWHIVPRWNGDTNFMAVLGQTNVIPQSLDTLWDLLQEEVGREGGNRR